MIPKLQFFLIACLIAFFLIIFYFLTRKKLNIKYTLVWLLMDIGMLTVVLFPQIVEWFGGFIGIATPINTTFLFAGMFLMLIVLTLTAIVSNLSNNLCRFGQYTALLEERVRVLEHKAGTEEKDASKPLQKGRIS